MCHLLFLLGFIPLQVPELRSVHAQSWKRLERRRNHPTNRFLKVSYRNNWNKYSELTFLIKFHFILYTNIGWFIVTQGFPGSSEGKESACNAGDWGLIPGSGRSPGEGTGYAPMDRGARWATVLGDTESDKTYTN